LILASVRHHLRHVLPAAAALALVAGGAALGAGQSGQPPPGQPSQPQPPAQPDQQRPTFRAGANLVRVDVSVIDHHGDPVTDLQKDDFEVREDGVVQTVETFKFVEANGQPAPDDDLSLPIRSPEHAAAEAARDEIRVFVIFWDEYHIGQMVPSILGKQALIDFVRNAFGPTDLVALMDPLTPLDAIRFTRDRPALADAISKFKGRLGVYLPPRSPIEEGQLYGGRDVETIRSQVTASALEGTILFLRSIREGRKTIVFVSQDIGPIGGRGPSGMGERYRWLDKAVRLANDSNTVLYTVDPRGFNGTMSDVLRGLAEETGGKAIQSNAPAVALRQAVKDASAFYLLGYPSAAPADGKFHRIKVRIKRGNYEVKARNGYLAPSLTELEAAHKAVVASTVPDDIMHAITTVNPRADSAGDLWVGATRGQDGSPRVTVSWLPRATAGQTPATPPPPIVITASAADDRVYFDGPLKSGTASFNTPSGVIKVRRTLLDADGSPGEREDVLIEVPDFDSEALAIATPILMRARTGVELNALRAANDVAPYAGHDFERTDRMLVRFAIFGRSATEATVTAQLLSKRGGALSSLTLRKRPSDSSTYEIELPIGSIARGDYVIAIEAAHGDVKKRTLVAFKAL
jgi:VWFA-related protein